MKLRFKPSTGTKKSERKLLHFGADYISLSIKSNSPQTPDSINFFRSLFATPHNTENSNFIPDMNWVKSDYFINLIFTESDSGSYILGTFNGYPILNITDIKTTKTQNVNKEGYEFRIKFYGLFFDFDRLNFLSKLDFLKVFLDDIQENKIEHCIGRLDICSDIAGVSPSDIALGIKGSKSHMKKLRIEEYNPATEEPETIYYGRRKQNWHARIYDKKKDINAKRKEFCYAGYSEYKRITRIETESHSDINNLYQVTLEKCLDKEFLWNIYNKLLNNQFVKWEITKFIKKELKKQNFTTYELEKRQHTPEELSNQAYFKRTTNCIQSCIDRYGYSRFQMLNAFRPHLIDSINAKELTPPPSPFQI